MALRQLLLISCLLVTLYLNAQDSLINFSAKTIDQSLVLTNKISSSLPTDKAIAFTNSIDKKADKYYSDVNAKTTKTLERLVKWEVKIRQLLEKVSPETESKLFAPGQLTFAELLKKYKEGKVIADQYKSQYDRYSEKISSSLSYLEDKKQLVESNLSRSLVQAKESIGKVQKQQGQTELIQNFIRERKKQLMQQVFQYLGKSKLIQKMDKETYYYIETLRNYKSIFNEPGKAEKIAINLLRKIPAFNDFLERNSSLASTFGFGGVANPNGTVGLLQTRASVQSTANMRASAAGINPQQMLQQVMQVAKTELNKWKEQLNQWGGNSDFEIPSFKPNSQRSKKFMQRIELSGDIQSTRHNSVFPVSSDLGFSAGYKPNDKMIIGLGISYKIGLGTGFNNIDITHQGLGLRSFIDWKLKKNIYLAGGYEQNYFAEIKNIDQLQDYSDWKSSALLGVSKKYSIGKKRKGEMKLLYDFFSKTKNPQTSSLLFRVGFGF